MSHKLCLKSHRQLTRRALLLALLPLLFVRLTLSQISVGPMITFDPTVAAKIGSEILQGAKVLATTIAAYEQIKWNAMFVTNKNVWRGSIFAAVSGFLNSTTPVTAPWAVAITSGANAAVGYTRATVALETNPKMIVVSDIRAPFYASAQLGAASNTAALQAIGNVHAFTAQNAPAIQNCQTAALSTDPALNTDAAQHNISNACAALALRQQEALLQLEAARTNMDLTRAKLETDTLSAHLNALTAAETSRLNRPSALVGVDQTLQTVVLH